MFERFFALFRGWDIEHPYASARDWAKDHSTLGEGGAGFYEIHPAQETVLHPPAYDFGCNSIFADHLREIYPASFLVAIPEGRLWQKEFEFNFVTAKDGRPLRDMTYRTFDYEEMTSRLQARPIRLSRPIRLKGTTLDLTCLGDGKNYCHWMLDCLSKLDWLSALPSTIRIDRLLVNRKMPFVMETLRSAGWADRDVTSLEETGPHLLCDRLLASSPITSAYHPTRLFLSVRRLLGMERPRSQGRRLYLSRADTHTRRVKNEEAVLSFLKPLGFESVHLSRLTVREQASLLASAECVIGPHGAGFTNISFCQEGTKILEWFPSGYSDLGYWSMSCALGLDYARMAFPPLSDDSKAADYAVELARLEQALKEMDICR